MIPKNAFNNDEAEKELNKIKEIENSIEREKLVYKTNKYTYDFRKFQTIRNFGKDNYFRKKLMRRNTLEEADEDQSDLLNSISDFKNETRPENNTKKQEKKLFLKTCIIFLRVEKKFLMLLEVKYF